MTDHAEFDLLSAYLDGELDDADRARVDAHLPGCSQCSTAFRALSATVADLRALEPVELDAASAAFIADRVAEARRFGALPSAGRLGAKRPWAWVSGAAAAAVLAIGFLALRAGDSPLTGSNEARRAETGAGLSLAAPYSPGGSFTRATAEAGLANLLTLAATQTETQRDTKTGSPSALAESVRAFAADGSGQSAAGPPPNLVKCAEQVTASSRDPLEPVRYTSGSYEGTQAFLLYFRAPAEAPTRAELWVMRASDCFVLHFAQRPGS